MTPFPTPPAHGVSSPMAFLNSTASQWCKDVIASIKQSWLQKLHQTAVHPPNPPDVMQPKCVNKFMACVTRVEGNQLIEVWTMLSRRLMWETSREKSAKKHWMEIRKIIKNSIENPFFGQVPPTASPHGPAKSPQGPTSLGSSFPLSSSSKSLKDLNAEYKPQLKLHFNTQTG